MARCHNCGKEVPMESGIRRRIRTGTQGDGAGFFRTVAFCHRCGDAHEEEEARQSLNRRCLLIIGAVLSVGTIAYLTLSYLGKL